MNGTAVADRLAQARLHFARALDRLEAAERRLADRVRVIAAAPKGGEEWRTVVAQLDKLQQDNEALRAREGHLSQRLDGAIARLAGMIEPRRPIAVRPGQAE